MERLIEKIIEDLSKFQTATAVMELQKWFSGESGLTSQDLKLIMNFWVDRFYQEKCSIDVNIDDSTMLQLQQMAHEEDLTFNQLVTLAIEEQFEDELRKKESRNE